MPLAVITDWFGCEMKEGDWVIYHPISIDPVGFRHGQISEFNRSVLSDSLVFVNMANGDSAQPSKCIKLSQEDFTMRKLESVR